MNIQEFMHRILKWIQHRGNRGFKKPALQQQLDFMHSFPEPKDDVERAYYQYLCQKQNEPAWKDIFFNISSFFMIPFYKMLMLRRGKKQVLLNKSDAVFISNGISDKIIPNSLKIEFPQMEETDFETNLGLIREDLVFVRQIYKKYRQPYFQLKILAKLSIYSSAIRRYSPKAVISYTEGSFTCALMTKYCENLGVEHINIQHGEYSYNTRACGMRFHRMYVWERYFYDALYTLSGFKVPYVIELPDSILKACERNKEGNYEYEITYYLQNQSKEELRNVRDMLKRLEQKGYRCKVRPHPRESEWSMLQQCLPDIAIEDIRTTSLYESLNTTEYVVSFRSTVLLEAWFNGKKILIDDYSSEKYLEELKGEDFFLLHKGVMMLSHFIEQHAEKQKR
ncbi:MAG: hypothetical protein HFI21_17025 [Lachnospiraceae bacterium]|nr:hypothetical protein [Lachnospiraceae bacterium]